MKKSVQYILICFICIIISLNCVKDSKGQEKIMDKQLIQSNTVSTYSKNVKSKGKEFKFTKEIQNYEDKVPNNVIYSIEHNEEHRRNIGNLVNVQGKGRIQSVELEVPENPPNYDIKMIRGNSNLTSISKANPKTVFVHGFKQEKVVALTFDDGPDNVNTPKLLDILKDQGVKATFFLIGKKIDGCEDVVRRAYEEGHLIAGHSFSHADLTKLTSQQAENELTQVDDKINSVIGRKISFIRPPCGYINQQVANIYNKHNYKAILWSIDTLDWQNHDKDKIYNNIMSKVNTSDIILCHMDENQQATLQAIPEVIKTLKAKGYRFERVDQLLQIKGYQ